jgi:hypothetical protein
MNEVFSLNLQEEFKYEQEFSLLLHVCNDCEPTLKNFYPAGWGKDLHVGREHLKNTA